METNLAQRITGRFIEFLTPASFMEVAMQCYKPHLRVYVAVPLSHCVIPSQFKTFPHYYQNPHPVTSSRSVIKSLGKNKPENVSFASVWRWFSLRVSLDDLLSLWNSFVVADGRLSTQTSWSPFCSMKFYWEATSHPGTTWGSALCISVRSSV